MEDKELLTKLLAGYLALDREVKALRADLDAFQERAAAAFKNAGFKMDVQQSCRKPVQEQPDPPKPEAAPVKFADLSEQQQIERTLADLGQTGVDLSEEAVKPKPIAQTETRNDLRGSWAPAPSQDGRPK